MSQLTERLNKLGRELAIELAVARMDFNLESVSMEVSADDTGAHIDFVFKGAGDESLSLDEIGNLASEYSKERETIVQKMQGIETAFPEEHG